MTAPTEDQRLQPGPAAGAQNSSAYSIGYRKPPVHTRFKPGQSGNPRGRPKGAKGVRGLVNSALDQTIRVAENGTPRAMKKREAVLTAMIAKAIRGDVRAAALVVRLMELHDPTLVPDLKGRQLVPGPAEQPFTFSDTAEFLRRALESHSQKT